LKTLRRGILLLRPGESKHERVCLIVSPDRVVISPLPIDVYQLTSNQVRVNDRLCLHDFRFQAGHKGYDLTALWLGNFKRVEAHSQTAHESRVVSFCNAHPLV
jgi:hypothetical protein